MMLRYNDRLEVERKTPTIFLQNSNTHLRLDSKIGELKIKRRKAVRPIRQPAEGILRAPRLTSIKMSDRQTTTVLISSTLVAFLSGFMFGVYSIRGYLISPMLAQERRANREDPVESEESDIDEDDTILDHAPNWTNGEEADRRQGLRAPARAAAPAAPAEPVVDATEECKLVLVVRTDLGMTKGMAFLALPTISLYRSSQETDPFFSLPRQDCSAMRPRNTGMLQNPSQGFRKVAQRPSGSATQEVGEVRPSQDRRADQEPGRDDGAYGQGPQLGCHGRSHPRRWTDPD